MAGRHQLCLTDGVLFLRASTDHSRNQHHHHPKAIWHRQLVRNPKTFDTSMIILSSVCFYFLVAGFQLKTLMQVPSGHLLCPCW